MLKVVQDPAEANSIGGLLLDEICRDGARQMLAAAVLAEVAAHIEAHKELVDAEGHRLVVRNGFHEPREVLTSSGAVPVRQPRVNDRRVDEVTGERMRFSSAILPAWSRKSPRLAEVLPLLYLHGLSSSDFAPALEQFLGSAAGLSAATITRLTAQWQEEAKAFGQRSLAGTDYVYCWADGIHLKVRLEQDKVCLLVIVGVRSDGRKELVALADGFRESSDSWADLLRDCKRRGMTAPVLAVGDGALGFLEGGPRRVPRDRGAALLVAPDRQRVGRAAQVGPRRGQEGDGGDLQRRGQRPRPGRGQGVPARLRRQVAESRGEDQRRSGRAAEVLRLPGRALDPPENQ
jgi:putative transposase